MLWATSKAPRRLSVCETEWSQIQPHLWQHWLACLHLLSRTKLWPTNNWNRRLKNLSAELCPTCNWNPWSTLQASLYCTSSTAGGMSKLTFCECDTNHESFIFSTVKLKSLLTRPFGRWHCNILNFQPQLKWYLMKPHTVTYAYKR